jgi:hypothetical protein
MNADIKGRGLDKFFSAARIAPREYAVLFGRCAPSRGLIDEYKYITLRQIEQLSSSFGNKKHNNKFNYFAEREDSE